MTETTHTMAGLLAAGAARLRAVAPAACSTGSLATAGVRAAASHPVSAGHLPTTWIEGAFAKQDTVMVLGRKNRPARLLPERSP